MSVINDKKNLRQLMSTRGFDVIGTVRTIAFASVASGGTGLLNITAAAHALQKGQGFYIAAGTYAGYYQVKKVISANVIQVEGTFTVTDAQNILLTGTVNGEGFIVASDGAAFVIAEIVPDDPNIDVPSLILAANDYVVGQEVNIPFSKLRLTTGQAICIRKQPQFTAPYGRK
jgi:hypothetical protein